MALFGKAGVVGLELDTGMIRAVQLTGKTGRARLVAAGMVELPEEAVVDGMVNDADAVSEALRRLWSEAGFSSREVVLGTYNQGVITRLIRFPKVALQKLGKAIRMTAQDYFPIPLAQMVLDHAVVGETQGEGGAEFEVLLVGARTADLEKSLAALQQARLKPLVIDASPLALIRVPSEAAAAPTAALVDIANGISSMTMVVHGVPRFTRVIPVSLQQFAGQPGMALQQAAAGAEDDGPAVEQAEGGTEGALVGWEWSAVEEINSTLSYFMKLGEWPELTCLVLSGRGARIQLLRQLLKDEMGVAVEVLQPLASLTGTGKRSIDRLLKQPDFGVSTGLALRGLEG